MSSKSQRVAAPALLPDIGMAALMVHRAFLGVLLRRLANLGYGDLTPAFATILPLIDVEGVRQVELAQNAGMSKQAISQLIAELQLRKYVELVPDPDDARAKIVRFTKRGIALRSAGFRVKEELRALIVETHGEGTLDGLIRGMVLSAEILTVSLSK